MDAGRMDGRRMLDQAWPSSVGRATARWALRPAAFLMGQRTSAPQPALRQYTRWKPEPLASSAAAARPKLRPRSPAERKERKEDAAPIEQVRTRRRRRPRRRDVFGYEIHDVDDFLTKASLECPANIPVVLGHPSVLYQTRPGGWQQEIALPLGVVLNAVFKNQAWLYVQTPHAQEGYVRYAACLPLGILPPPGDRPWESAPPPPCGNLTDTEARSSRCCSRADSTCDEKSVDELYLRAAASGARAAAASGAIRQTLIVANCDYAGRGRQAISVSKGEVLALLGADGADWFWVRARDGREGFIPAAVGGHGFL